MIKRELFKDLKEHLGKKEITFIVGPRQAGKTTLMLLLKEYLDKLGEKTVYLTLDIEADRQFFTSQESLIKKIKLAIGGKGYVFIDEIQRKENAGIFLKGIYDMNLPYKFIVSGSGSVELREKIHESLVGRKRIFELSTLNFEEFVNFKTDYKYEGKLREFFEIDTIKALQLLEEYLNFGGYPRVVLEETLIEKQRVIEEIYQSYLEKDIAYLLGRGKEEAFSQLVRILASQIGKMVNVSELSSTLGISVKTVKTYLWYLEKTFILQRITPYFSNTRKEITKSSIFYFYDLGLRNYAAKEFGNAPIASSVGFLFQNFIANILKEKISHTPLAIHFWRTKDGAEVDFIIDTVKAIPIEVKYKELKTLAVTRSFRNFLSKYHPSIAYVIHLGAKSTEKIDNTSIYLLPYYGFLSEKL